MNLMVVSEKHGLMIIAVDHELYVYRIDPVSLTFCNPKNFKKITLGNDEVSVIKVFMWLQQEINNIKLI